MNHSTAQKQRKQKIDYDLTAARRHLRSLAAMAAEGATSPNPQVTALALAVARYQGQAEAGR